VVSARTAESKKLTNAHPRSGNEAKHP
jgi:hypothetical protein